MQWLVMYFFVLFSLNYNAHSQKNECVNYEWEKADKKIITIPISILFSENDSSSVFKKECLYPLVKKYKRIKKEAYISYTFYNESKRHTALNKYFNNVVYNYLISQGIKEENIFDRFNTFSPLPPPIINGKMVDIDDDKNENNDSYIEFKIEYENID